MKGITGQTLANRAHIHIENGRYAEAGEVLGEAETVARETGVMTLLSHCLGNQGVVSRLPGDLDQAWRLHQEQREICESLSDRQGLGVAICQQALVLEELGKTDEALAQYREAALIGLAAAAAYVDRCRALQAAPPKEAWNVVWLMTSK